jgi:hypothetical protein
MSWFGRSTLVAGVFLVGCFSPSDSDTQTETETGSTGAATGTTGMNPTTGSNPTTGNVDGSTTEAPQAPSCEEYCTLVDDHCTGDLAQYSGVAACEAVCAAMPPGEVGDELGNTVGCRTYHAIAAAEDADTHCPHAGPSGGMVCGSPCESFCTLAAGLCLDGNAQYADTEACLAECMMFPTDSDSIEGDTYACRMYHLTVAALDPDTHCPHIVLDSPVCIDMGGSETGDSGGSTGGGSTGG